MLQRLADEKPSLVWYNNILKIPSIGRVCLTSLDILLLGGGKVHFSCTIPLLDLDCITHGC
jgi:hypothetical protein